MAQIGFFENQKIVAWVIAVKQFCYFLLIFCYFLLFLIKKASIRFLLKMYSSKQASKHESKQCGRRLPKRRLPRLPLRARAPAKWLIPDFLVPFLSCFLASSAVIEAQLSIFRIFSPVRYLSCSFLLLLPCLFLGGRFLTPPTLPASVMTLTGSVGGSKIFLASLPLSL